MWPCLSSEPATRDTATCSPCICSSPRGRRPPTNPRPSHDDPRGSLRPELVAIDAVLNAGGTWTHIAGALGLRLRQAARQHGQRLRQRVE